jgi:CO/xanthine dehydrogenase Mo-binding subunit
MGFATMENAILHQGKYSTWNFDTYMMPAIQDAPESISVSALEDLEADDAYGPRGIGELGIGAIAPAIANAVADAIGYWPECAPIEPEHILKALAKAT